MVTDSEIRQGVKTIKCGFAGLGKRGSNVSRSETEDNRQRLRALEGVCGECKKFTIRYDARNRVMLDCLKGNSPIDLYRNTELGRLAACLDFDGR